MACFNERVEPMALANMRQLGERSVFAPCSVGER
jgi:hypothetical protein